MYTDLMTRDFYDADDTTYRGFWDAAGSLHWGVFEPGDTDFLTGCQRWTEEMLALAQIGPESRVLDLGCGNGTVAAWLARHTGASVTGIDLSPVRIANALRLAAVNPDLRLDFVTGTASALPFPDNSFTHVFSQAVLYHVHARDQALAEVVRVVEPEGLFTFDDLVTPQRPVSAQAREVIYDRLLFEPTFSQREYVDSLMRHGFVVLQVRDLSPHLARSYELLAELAAPNFPKLAACYRQIPDVVGRGEVGWAFFFCQKVVDKLAWIYRPDPRVSLDAKYDAWAGSYDADMGNSYHQNPCRSATLLTRHVRTGDAPILDVGAGTGLVGQELRALGYHNVTALDPSAGMLELAHAKGLYRRLVRGTAADAPMLLAPQCFAAIIGAGVFTFNHAQPADLVALDRVLDPGGCLVIAVRADYLAAQHSMIATLTSLGYAVIADDNYEIFDGEPMIAMAWRKPLGPVDDAVERLH